MLKKLICIIFAACILHAVPAHADYINQLENGLNQYIQNELTKEIQRDYPGYNTHEIGARVARFNDRCAVIVDISSGPDDPRIISLIADHIAYETYSILKNLGLTDRTSQQLNLMLIAIPIKNKIDNWIFYDASIVYWEGANLKIKRYNGRQTYYILALDKYYKKVPGDKFGDN